MSRKRAEQELEAWFPALSTTAYSVESPKTKRYNCIAWAAGDMTRRWDPSHEPKKVPGFYWPDNASGYFEIEDLVSVFVSLGYDDCNDGSLEVGYEKVALYEDMDPNCGWSHAARQLPDGRWTSKIGKLWDIIHQTPDAVSGKEYGKVVRFLRRASSGVDPCLGGTKNDLATKTGG